MNETIYLAGGCFWGLQKYLDDEVDGIISTECSAMPTGISIR